MRVLAPILAVAALATAALADTPVPVTVPDKATEALPLSLWRPVDAGGYEHVQTGLVCPAANGLYRRHTVETFDGFGLDVGCDYTSANATLTYYLSRRSGTGLEAAMTEAKRELVEAGTARHSQLISDTRSHEGGLDWMIALYGEDNALRQAIWITDLSGWTLEYRISYHADDEARIAGEMRALTAQIQASAGARLAVCAKAKPAERHGQPITDKAALESAAMMSSLLGGAARASGKPNDTLETQPLTLCVEGAGKRGGIPMLYWRSIRQDGTDSNFDVVTALTKGPPPTLSVSGGGVSALLALIGDKPDKPPQWIASTEQNGQTLIFGFFAGRPTTEQLGDLFAAILTGKLKAMGGYSADGKKITIVVPPK